MKLDELGHLPVFKCPFESKMDLPKVPVELADVEFEESGHYRPVYVMGIYIPTDVPNRTYLVWTNEIKIDSGKYCNILRSELGEITRYRSHSL